VSDAAQAELDARLMARALAAAEGGDPSPNPHVGAVVARGEELLGVGHHARCGSLHAEVVALRKSGEHARGATLYVTLEPCNHDDGRTSPCTEAIIAAGIARVVIGYRDPAPHVPGSTRKLRRHGIVVVHDIMKQRAARLVADFEKFALQGLPQVTLKAALTLDGHSAARSGKSQWITGELSRREVHAMRARADAVMVGVGTVLADDPELTVRAVRGRNPLRVVLDSRLRTPARSKIVVTARDVRTLIFHAPGAPNARLRQLSAAGVELVEVPRQKRAQGLDLRIALGKLAERDVVRLLVEGGAHVHGALLDAGLADRVAVFIAPRILGDVHGFPFSAGERPRRLDEAVVLHNVEVKRFGVDVLVRGDVTQQNVARSKRTGTKAGPQRRTQL
jgi:diaminohydroxyphosphoribosylaminopyrimidine deaminase/5-amino-6-(5-phosphoribosylamino)uracil reductase